MFDTVLTPNRRLAATLQKIYNNQYVNKGMLAWPTPDVLPMNAWLLRTWEAFANHSEINLLVLGTSQEKLLWEYIIRRTKAYDHLLRVSETAEKAYAAYNLLKQWRIDLNHPLFDQTEDCKALQSWAIDFECTAKQSHWIPQVSLADVLAEKIDQRLILPTKTIGLYGFTDISPQLKHLLSRLPTAPEILTDLPVSSTNQRSYRFASKDCNTELLTMARWAKSISQKENRARIGCVIPNLDKIRERVIQVFSEVLGDATLFNISAGKSLQHYPVIKMALQLLSLNTHPLSYQSVSEVITTPFIGEAEVEKYQRFSLDVQLRQENCFSMTLTSSQLSNCPKLKKRIEQFLILQDDKKRSYYDWSLRFTDMLLALGWPGERSLNSEEYQTIDTWMSLLQEFSTLDYVDKPVYLNQALSTLKRMASNKTFQPESPDANIQLLGLLEAASLPFDYLWIMGMSDLAWPEQPTPNPFIPKQLQRDLKMPHATAERELHFSTVMTAQFKQSASDVIFSYPESDDEIGLQPSPLISELPIISEKSLKLEPYRSIIEQINSQKALEFIDDQTGPPVTNHEITGGVDVLKQQALCPFKAFSLYRLQARILETPLPGLKAKTRGRIIHQVLEKVWSTLKDHETLINTEQESLKGIIVNAIERVFSNQSPTPNHRPEYTKLEKFRLLALILDWLALEKKREPFTVLSQEEKNVVQIGKLNVTVRVDRIDEISSHHKLILDYKTGKNNASSSWFSERLEEPQLPVYTLLDPAHTAGITYAQVAADELCFKGVSQIELGVDGVKKISQWHEQLAIWKNNLDMLGNEFANGVANVNPLDGKKTCEWCELEPLCRINEHG